MLHDVSMPSLCDKITTLEKIYSSRTNNEVLVKTNSKQMRRTHSTELINDAWNSSLIVDVPAAGTVALVSMTSLHFD